MSSISDLRVFDEEVPAEPPYAVEIVSESRAPVTTASGIPITPNRAIDEIERTDLVIIPSIMTDSSQWQRGRHPAISEWLRAMHAAGALLCSSCSGVFLLADTGLLDGKEATLHWSHAKAFQRAFPQIPVSLEKILVTAGGRSEFVMSGASSSWHDLVLYLVSRQLGSPAAYALAKFHAMQWHADGQAPYMVFTPPLDHGDAAVLKAQDWLKENHSVENPVDKMVERSGIPARSFKRRFANATGLSPIQYVQHLRIDQAKRWLEKSRLPVDEVSWQIGYEDPAFFRRLFKRLTGMTPSAYRKTFTLPDFDAV
jgi:transcriptional regulator GlxA family with amidase domain